LLADPDWAAPVRLTLRKPVDKQRSLVGREARPSLAHALHCSISYRAALDRDHAAALLTALQARQDQPVLVPAWPFLRPYDDYLESAAPVRGGLYLAFNAANPSSFSLVIDVELDQYTYDWAVPVLWCKPERAPKVVLDTPEFTTVQFEFREDGPAQFPLQPVERSWTSGPALGAYSPYVFPWVHGGLRAQDSGADLIAVDRRTLGPSGRMQAAAAYEQDAERLVSAEVAVESADDIAALMRWFADHGGSTPFYVSSGQSVCRLVSVDQPGDDYILEVDNAALLGANRVLAIHRYGLPLEIRRVASIAGNYLDIGGALGSPLPTSTDVLALAALARHAQDEIELSFASPEYATSTLHFRELPAEYTIPTGETRGTTMGALAIVAWLYEIVLDWGGASVQTTRLTSHERTVTAGGQTYIARPIEHGEILRSLRLERDNLSIRTRWWDNCPWRVWLPGYMDAKMLMRIYRCTVNASGVGGTPVLRYTGEVDKVTFDGPFIEAQLRGINNLFDRRCPRRLMQQGCNHALFDAGCTLDLEEWQFAGSVESWDGNEVSVGNLETPEGVTGWTSADYFALGYLEYVASGETIRHGILRSSYDLGEDVLELILARPLRGNAPAGVTVVPGCDGMPVTCHDKFNNRVNFGGFPEVPTKSPSFQPLKKSTSNSGKK
jgi:uncharacterized phage protein (TIGR02218 family)